MLEHIIDGAIVAFQLKHIALALAGAVFGFFLCASGCFRHARYCFAGSFDLFDGARRAVGISRRGLLRCYLWRLDFRHFINVPGTPAAVATMLDGYEMTKQGKGGQALGLATVASLMGGQFSVIVLLFGAPLVATVALEIRSAEFFWIVIFAMGTVGAIGAGSPLKGIIAAVLGLAIGLIGAHQMTGILRFAFGEPALYTGVPVVSALVGLFSISQFLILAEGKCMDSQLEVPKIGSLWPSRDLLWRLRKTLVRSSIIGTVVCLIPGAGADIASFIGRSEAKRYLSEPEMFGKRPPDAVLGVEAANNTVVGGSLIPMLTLGIYARPIIRLRRSFSVLFLDHWQKKTSTVCLPLQGLPILA